MTLIVLWKVLLRSRVRRVSVSGVVILHGLGRGRWMRRRGGFLGIDLVLLFCQFSEHFLCHNGASNHYITRFNSVHSFNFLCYPKLYLVDSIFRESHLPEFNQLTYQRRHTIFAPPSHQTPYFIAIRPQNKFLKRFMRQIL